MTERPPTAAPSTQPPSFRERDGFSLAEVLIALAIFSLITAGLVSSFDFIYKSSIGMGNYADMNVQSRRTLDIFGREVRTATDVTSASATSVTIVVPDGAGTSTITYAFNATDNTFDRTEGGTTMALLKDVDTCSLTYYTLRGVTTTALLEVKNIQLEAEMIRKVLHLKNTNQVISARYMLRNRTVSN